ncbi:hypothetical protein RR48_01235 [Papilio machaon]|uniref:Uncharacterized protein n=1 Tax=Papilio machaon TaxID=76193 RepID=A0A0N1IQD1_PAPMA|nr:hypothetical protein RR48_01235 [Papilio machaon]
MHLPTFKKKALCKHRYRRSLIGFARVVTPGRAERDYAVGVWGHVAHKQYIKKILQRLQRGFAIKAIKAFRTVSTTAALALAQFTPLDLKILEQHAIETTRLTGTSPVLPNNIPLEPPTPPGDLHPAHKICKH